MAEWLKAPVLKTEEELPIPNQPVATTAALVSAQTPTVSLNQLLNVISSLSSTVLTLTSKHDHIDGELVVIKVVVLPSFCIAINLPPAPPTDDHHDLDPS
ncbi:hypothetical protein L2E82_31352 [Cichorium intybus]|uniref:Uncharacterized protein n=1 Tax=Cichorium intybus TaxID=13427 RepID=A0ACB9D3L9_CICIN|nr:hypothetical protein L2E82_31352 [Cichorium intybus]